MAKIHTNICIDPEAYSLAQANVKNLSKFVNDSIYAACANSLSKADKKKIPREKLLEAAVRNLTNKLKESKAKVVTLSKENKAIITKYNRMMRRK